MTLQKPKVEFVPIDKNAFIQAASPCPDWWTSTPTGGGQRCIGSQIDAGNCPDWEGLVEWTPEN